MSYCGQTNGRRNDTSLFLKSAHAAAEEISVELSVEHLHVDERPPPPPFVFPSELAGRWLTYSGR